MRETNGSAPPTDEILRVEGLTRHYQTGGVLRRVASTTRALDGVSLSLRAGESLGIVGESGCGKTTLARCLARLIEPTDGRIIFEGRDITHLPPQKLRQFSRGVQYVFQDPYASLDPRMRVRDIVAEPLRIQRVGSREERARRVAQLLDHVGLRSEHAARYPHEFSGGQRQRIGLARALALNPRLLILDEPVSALDVSIQAQVINLLKDLQQQFNLTYIVIAHDLAVIRQISHRIAVMYLGRVVETGTRRQIYERPSHPYTQALLSAAPVIDPARPGMRRRIVLTGDPASPTGQATVGCRFRSRCFRAEDRCAAEDPALHGDRAGTDHPTACHFAGPLTGATETHAVAG